MPIWSKSKVQSPPAPSGDEAILSHHTSAGDGDSNGPATTTADGVIGAGSATKTPSSNGSGSRKGSMDKQSNRRSRQQQQQNGGQDGNRSFVDKPKLVFHCQQAQGSPTGLISGFTSIKDLYQKIADCYDFSSTEILFCTLNTHKVDMEHLLAGQIGLDDFIFAHRKGQTKEVELTKTEDALGLTITDNGNGYCFIKRIKEGSVMDKIEYVQVGDHLERINAQSLVGKKHFEVAKLLKDIPRGTNFTVRLVEPLNSFANIGPRNAGTAKKGGYGTGRETLRLRANGPATVEELPDDEVQVAITKINSLLESFLGINDSQLATQICEMGQDKKNPIDFSEAVENSELAMFGFTEDFVFDIWGIISDAKAGRLQSR